MDTGNGSETARRMITVLIVGVDNVGKRSLAEALLKEFKSQKVAPHVTIQIRLEDKLSPTNINQNKRDTDLIIIMVDLTAKHSTSILKDLCKLDADIFTGSLTFVILGTMQRQQSVGLDTVALEIKKYGSPVLYGHSKTPAEFKVLAQKLWNVAAVASGLKFGIPACVLSLNCAPQFPILPQVI